MMQRDAIQKKFRVFIWLSLFVLLMEVAGGVITNSLALFSDAGHVLIDLLALLLAYFALRLARRGTTQQFTYGYYRAEILAAMANAIVLFLLTILIFYESYLRFRSPQPINGPEMFVIAVVGLAANLYVVIKMHGDERENLNVRGAYLHVLSDTISSVGVVCGGGSYHPDRELYFRSDRERSDWCVHPGELSGPHPGVGAHPDGGGPQEHRFAAGLR